MNEEIATTTSPKSPLSPSPGTPKSPKREIKKQALEKDIRPPVFCQQLAPPPPQLVDTRPAEIFDYDATFANQIMSILEMANHYNEIPPPTVHYYPPMYYNPSALYF